MTSSVPVTPGALHVPGARLHYELRGSGPLVALVGAPMSSAAFTPLTDVLAADHTVLTHDPRGHFGSVLDDPESDSTPELRADDLARLIRHVGVEPATVIGSSGGAVTTLALIQAHPDVVGIAAVHEPPLAQLLDDSAKRLAASEDAIATYAAGDRLGGVRKFMAFAGFEMPEAMFMEFFGGDRNPEEEADERYFYLHEMRGTARWTPDLDALRSTSARVVVGIGDASAGQLCDLASRALAAELKIEPTMFSGGHTGFLENPADFITRLREAIATGE